MEATLDVKTKHQILQPWHILFSLNKNSQTGKTACPIVWVCVAQMKLRKQICTIRQLNAFESSWRSDISTFSFSFTAQCLSDRWVPYTRILRCRTEMLGQSIACKPVSTGCLYRRQRVRLISYTRYLQDLIMVVIWSALGGSHCIMVSFFSLYGHYEESDKF